jgi:signal transduction histidine kinase
MNDVEADAIDAESSTAFLQHLMEIDHASEHGLGLSSSQAIVESHGGTIGFTNLPAGGVRFWFRLPMASN